MATTTKTKATTAESKETNIGIVESNKQSVADELNKLLSDEFVLYTKTRKFHWNVEGAQFHDLHLFFEKQYNQLALIIDEVAERVRKLGHYALGSMKHYLKEASLLENEDKANTAESMLQELLDDHETIIRRLRSDIEKFQDKYKDAGSADFITGLVEQHETMAWMLRATAKR
ncbi:DNA starvation/stationary phase protection protein [Taibaiella lutea]|uniref:DNA starvation/stationary phase protection protein n=1 Tax=Taibaiella lutea TaxID=2608001 RepID=A0A5M6CH13_9BACT|nr:DNA starvation/stationary phase protection protein [Taibaiella lutea]KAA5533212.1 DNA starvation/stationary phase protection protein [Taibaiella lutea]